MGYGKWYATHPETIVGGCEVTLLVPKAFVGAFGKKVRYLEARDIYRLLPCLMPHYDLWHSIHQMSPFRPCSHSTRRILTIHDVNFIYEKQGAKRQKYIRRLQRECDSADELCFISRFAQKDTAQYINIGGKPQHVIYNGVATLTEGQQEPVEQALDGRPFMLSIGVLKAKKNLHALLPMMDLLPEYRLIIAGDNSDAYAQQLREQLPQHPNVSIVGTVSNEQRRWLYAHCTALLFPSLSEGFGLPVIEAMQWGKPVFCSNRTSLPEIGSTHAFYFTDFEPENMAGVVRQGLAAFDAAAAGAEQKYAAAYSYESHMRQYWSIYTTK